jgi:pimeloyl-ACP methyl ester carboxylesterase
LFRAAIQTVAIEAGLRALHVPTLIVWRLDDIFFELKWAYWLKNTIPGAVEVVEVPSHCRLWINSSH